MIVGPRVGGPLPGERFYNSFAFQKIWAHVVSPVTFWSLLGPAGATWHYLEPLAAIWTHLEPPGILKPFVPFRSIWGHLDPVGAIWKLLDNLEPFGLFVCPGFGGCSKTVVS